MERRHKPQETEVLGVRLTIVTTGLGERLLHVNGAVADEWAGTNTTRPVPVIDAFLAATVNVNSLTFMTRKSSGGDGFDIDLLNKFEVRCLELLNGYKFN